MSSPADDASLAGPRTALAWQRTALVFATLAALCLGAAAHRHELAAGAAGAAILAGVALAVRRRGERPRRPERPGDPAGVRLVAGATVGAAALVAVLVVAGH